MFEAAALALTPDSQLKEGKIISWLLATCVTVRQPKSASLPAKRRRFGATRKALLSGPRLAAIALLVLVPACHPASVLAQSSSFQVLGPMPGSVDGGFTFASGVSADGSTIVGAAYVCPDGGTTCTDTGKTEAFRWTVAGGYEVLGDLGGPYGSYAYATSADGSVAVGDAAVPPRDICGAFRWTAAEGMQPLPYPPLCRASAVSADGASIVGRFEYLNISGQSGMFGPFPGEQSPATALGLSGDGQVAVGYAVNGSNVAGPTLNAFRWTLADGLQDIGVPNHNSDADAISADGSVIVGEFEFQVRPVHLYHAFRWTEPTGMVDLGTLGDAQSRALATNSDGGVVVGLTSNLAFRWTAQTGMQDLNQLVGAGNCGGHPWPLDCFVLKTATGVSADGTVITGDALAPSPDSTWPVGVPFRAVVPLP